MLRVDPKYLAPATEVKISTGEYLYLTTCYTHSMEKGDRSVKGIDDRLDPLGLSLGLKGLFGIVERVSQIL